MEKTAIYCPQCRWQPGSQDRWRCEPRCGTLWNTFWTRGLCPGCGKQWQVTQCPACGRYSLHERWYHTPPGRDTATKRKTVTAG